jgi:hypothetical protein
VKIMNMNIIWTLCIVSGYSELRISELSLFSSSDYIRQTEISLTSGIQYSKNLTSVQRRSLTQYSFDMHLASSSQLRFLLSNFCRSFQLNSVSISHLLILNDT